MTVTVYSKPACVQCTQSKKKLDQLGVVYNVIDVTEDANALEYVKSLGYMAAPVIVAGEQHWAGFQPDKIKALVS
jgi:glutaredoxin-like protein NrdH